jgi:hypothetical protein
MNSGAFRMKYLSLSALARAHHRTTIGIARTGAPTSAAN